MRRLSFGSNSAVFVLFFGVALIEAIRHGDWMIAAIFLALGILSMRGDATKETAS